ncbi:MAG: aldo/keto reductase, partial [Myxococcota bacterium]
AEVELLPMASSEGLGVFPYSPLAAGLLTGKYSGEPDADLGRLSHNTMYQARYGDPNYAEVARQFAALARELGHHPASLAIAWVGAHSSVSAPILGARNVEQIRPALASVDIEVTPELYRRIAHLSPEPPPATDRNEEGSSATLDRR